MLSFNLNSISSKQLSKDVLVRLVQGDELTINYFMLKNNSVKIPSHEHPVEHLVVVLEGELQFRFKQEKINLKMKDCFFVPPRTKHTARVIQGPVKALEIFKVTEDEYYNR